MYVLGPAPVYPRLPLTDADVQNIECAEEDIVIPSAMRPTIHKHLVPEEIVRSCTLG